MQRFLYKYVLKEVYDIIIRQSIHIYAMNIEFKTLLVSNIAILLKRNLK